MNNERYKDLQDEEIIRMIRSENSSILFGVLYERYYRKVLDKCFSFVKNRNVAEELVEDIFSKTYEKLDSFKYAASFSSWLYSVTYNHCIDYLREKKKLSSPDWIRDMEMSGISDVTDEDDPHFDPDKLNVILDMIHPEEKALLLMKYHDSLLVKQIGMVLGISDDAVKMRLKRARAKVNHLYVEKFLKEQ